MEVYNNKDHTVTKYLHNDGSETCIKVVPSCNYEMRDQGLVEVQQDRQKYSVFISHSSGCPIGCKMCYLTIKKYPYCDLSFFEITNNVCDAIRSKLQEMPELKDRYIKLCWMGMGDPLLDLTKVDVCTKQILWFVMDNKYARGLDGVDIGTVMPTTENLSTLNDLNQTLRRAYPRNIYNTDPYRSTVRVMYSLHCCHNRNKLIPLKAKTPLKDLEELKYLSEYTGINVICHQIFLEGINDDNYTISCLKEWFKKVPFELRILRYNKCRQSLFTESSKFDSIVQELNSGIPRIKYQISPGSEIKAACGQFILGKLTTEN